MNARSANAAGFTIIEVMVALAVLSIGMLGIASLYTQALGASRTTQYRSQAMNLISDMADRIRVNSLGQASYEGPGGDNNCDPGDANDCTPAEMALHDRFLWDARVAAVLPGGVPSVAHDGTTTPPTYTIQVTWDEVAAGQLTAAVTLQVPNN